jgi:hypothetical protein
MMTAYPTIINIDHRVMVRADNVSMPFQFNDGGRKQAGYQGYTRDCVTRAIAIATQQDYQIVYDAINELAKRERKRGKSNARTGVYKPTIRRYMESIGWVWVATMQIGSGCTVHLRDGELPMGRLVVNVSKHSVAVIDGVINDTYDCSRNGTRCVYGYYYKPTAETLAMPVNETMRVKVSANKIKSVSFESVNGSVVVSAYPLINLRDVIDNRPHTGLCSVEFAGKVYTL